MDSLAARSPLQNRSLSREQFTVRENNAYGLIRLQTFHRRAGQIDNVAARLGLALPGPGSALEYGDMQFCWSAPGEWVITVPRTTERDRLSELRTKLNGLFAELSVMTDSRVALQIGGEQLCTVLSRGSSVDFDPTVFTTGNCLSTRFAGVPVMLLAQPAEECLLFADRSVAAYLLDWFQAASRDC